MEEAKGKRIEQVCASLQMGVHYVQPDEYLESLGALAGMQGFTKKGAMACDAVFGDEMVLFCELLPKEIHKVLDSLRSNGVSLSLKASLTRHNVHWNSLQMHKETLEEQKALQA